MRWGIFWRSIRFSLADTRRIIMAAVKLHNFIKDNCDDRAQQADSEFFAQSFSQDSSEMNSNSDDEFLFPSVLKNDTAHCVGRLDTSVAERRASAIEARNEIMRALERRGFVRPDSVNIRRNQFSHAFFG